MGGVFLKITIVVPCYNEEKVLDLFYDELCKWIDDAHEYNILFIDDGSKDNTQSCILRLSKKDTRVKFVTLSRNFGKEAALLAGLENAKRINSDVVIIIDADLQDPPSLIPSMIALHQQGYKHIYAKHKSRKGEPKLKTFFAMRFYSVYSFFTRDINMEKGARDFSLMDIKVVDAFLTIKDSVRFTKGICSWVGFEKKCIEFDYVPRIAGKSKWSFVKLFRYGVSGIHQFSTMYKLMFRTIIVIATIFIMVDITFSLMNGQQDYRLFMFEIFFLVIFILLGALLEVIYSIRNQTLNRPHYIIDESNLEL
ncbi:MAG: glycosyltransferase family 2 protein [bacterium]